MIRHMFSSLLVFATAASACDRAEPQGDVTTSAPSTVTPFHSQATPPRPALRSATGFVGDIDALTRSNDDFRRVLFTSRHSQLVLMSVPIDEHVGKETHDVDQFLRVEEGSGELVLNGDHFSLHDGSAIVVPAGAEHDVINKGTAALKLYTIYSPPHHRDGVVHHTRADAARDREHFDGETTP